MAKKNTTGHIYILTNPSFRYLKIGHTKNNPHDRAAQLSRSQAIPIPFKVAYAKMTEGCLEVETAIKAMLDGHCVGKEFFNIPLEKAIEIIEENFEVMSAVEHMRQLYRPGDRTQDKAHE